VHAFGAGGTRTFPALFAFGADSADSIGWRQAAGFGSIFLPLKSQRVIAVKRGKRAVRKLLDASDFPEIEACECPICIAHGSLAGRLAALRSGFHQRAIHNAWILCNQFKYWPRDRRTMLSMVSSGYFGRKWADSVNSG
jgi:hypothetical protein